MRTEYLSPKTLDALIGFMTPCTALPMRVSMETGLRIGDVVSLRTENLVGTEIRYTAHKTKKQGVAKISVELMNLLLRNCDNGYLFPSANSKYGHISRQAVWKQVKKAALIANIEKNIAPHTARKTYAVGEFKAHGLAAVQKALQHSRVDTTLLYCLSDTSFLENHEQINSRLDALFEKLDEILDLLNNKKTDA